MCYKVIQTKELSPAIPKKMLYKIILCLYPIYATMQSLSKARIAQAKIRHWMTFWFLFGILELVHPLLSTIPFSEILCIFALFLAYSKSLMHMVEKDFLVPTWKRFLTKLKDLNKQSEGSSLVAMIKNDILSTLDFKKSE